MSSGWPERYPIFQPPNASMLVAQGARLVAAITRGRVSAVARFGSYVALAAWAWDELASGTNLVRRAVGAVALARVVSRAVEWARR